MRPVELIQEQVNKLKEIKPSVRKTSAFGDNHHDAIDAQIDVLENKLTLTKIDQHYGVDDTMEDEDEQPQNVYDAAVEAYEWLFERSEDLPSDGWKELIMEPA